MSIPFKTGEVVFDEFFTDRAEEVERIRRAMTSTERLLVYGERRQGKSSAIRQASLPIAAGGGIIVRVDPWTTETVGELVRRVVAAIPYGWSLRDRLTLFLAQAGVEPKITLDAVGNPGFALGLRASRLTDEAAREILIRVLTGLDEIAGEYGKPVVLVLDEFQQIDHITRNGAALLRGIMQETPHLAYVLAGSFLSLVNRLIAVGGPLYNIPRLDIGPIDANHLARWIEDRMSSHGVRPEPGVGRRILEMAGPRTEYCIRLARECYLHGLARGEANVDGVEGSFRDLALEGTSAYETIWTELPNYQKTVLRALATGERHLHGAEAREVHDLPSSGSISKAVRLLRERGYASSRDPIEVADPFFGAWIRMHAMPDGRPR